MPTLRSYFDNKVPVAPGEGRPSPGGQVQSWQAAWTELSKQLYHLTPQRLDKVRVTRNRFMSAVR